MKTEQEIVNKVERFKNQMLYELENNNHKGPITDWDDYEQMVCDLEYHKAKMMMAITTCNRPAAKEYIADCANILMAIGNFMGLYGHDIENQFESHEINRLGLIRAMPISDKRSSKTPAKDGMKEG